MKYTIALTDPDAPTRNDPKWSEMCHWIATGVSLKDAEDDDDDSNSSELRTFKKHKGHKNHKGLEEVMEYKPPGPPPKTGKHRYVFLAFAPANGTTKKLHLSKPEDRKHWGFGKADMGVRQWAAENGLAPVGEFDQGVALVNERVPADRAKLRTLSTLKMRSSRGCGYVLKNDQNQTASVFFLRSAAPGK